MLGTTALLDCVWVTFIHLRKKALVKIPRDKTLLDVGSRVELFEENNSPTESVCVQEVSLESQLCKYINHIIMTFLLSYS